MLWIQLKDRWCRSLLSQRTLKCQGFLVSPHFTSFLICGTKLLLMFNYLLFFSMCACYSSIPSATKQHFQDHVTFIGSSRLGVQLLRFMSGVPTGARREALSQKTGIAKQSSSPSRQPSNRSYRCTSKWRGEKTSFLRSLFSEGLEQGGSQEGKKNDICRSETVRKQTTFPFS